MEILFKSSIREGMRKLFLWLGTVTISVLETTPIKYYCKSTLEQKSQDEDSFSPKEIIVFTANRLFQTDKLIGLSLWGGSFLKSHVGFVSGANFFLHPML